MVKDLREKERESSGNKGGGEKFFVSLIWNCAVELKFLLVALLLICSLATLLQFLPAHLSLSASSVRLCLSATPTTRVSAATPTTRVSAATPTTRVSAATPTTRVSAATPSTRVSAATSTATSTNISSQPTPSVKVDQLQGNGVLKRAFNPYGVAAYNFVLMSAYRGGANTFAVMGLASKPLHIFGRPTYKCDYESPHSIANATTSGVKILPDWGYGRVYTVVVINCSFPYPVGTDGSGGRLILQAATNGAGDRDFNLTDTIEALIEPPGSVNLLHFISPPKYEYLYCGSSLYGNLSPQRVREWMAYHVRLFGKRSHFVIHDAGGIQPEVMEVLRPWMELGYVSLHDIREQERFDGYYHNQFLIVNDCLHRYRFMARWIFFFDVDEFIYVPGKSSLRSVMDSLKDFSQFTIEQMPMSSKLCLSEDAGKTSKKWGFEKLVYRDVKKGIRRDRKYAVQPRHVFATGVHMSQNLQGKTTHRTERRVKYFHYHGTIAERRDPCRRLINDTQTTVDGIPYVRDTTMRSVAPFVKRFELKTIGHRLRSTRQ